MSEGHDSGHGSGHGAGSEGHFKRSIFAGLILVLLVFVFFLFRNLDLILRNAWWMALAVLLIFLFARYDFILFLRDYERAVIFRLGRVNRVGGPGWALTIPAIESHETVDLRTKTVDIPRQDVVTKDGIEVNIDAVVYLKVRKENQSVINSIVEIDDYVKASELFVSSLIRSEIGKLELTELFSRVEDLDERMKESLEKIAQKWGVTVEEAVIQDIKIPPTVLEAMHQQKAAVQKKLARIEEAQGHQAEIEAVKAAASQLNDTALAYYYVKALEKLGEGKSSKIIFPMELTNLARALTERAGSHNDIESLMKKYAPVVKAIAGGAEKKK